MSSAHHGKLRCSAIIVTPHYCSLTGNMQNQSTCYSPKNYADLELISCPISISLPILSWSPRSTSTLTSREGKWLHRLHSWLSKLPPSLDIGVLHARDSTGRMVAHNLLIAAPNDSCEDHFFLTLIGAPLYCQFCMTRHMVESATGDPGWVKIRLAQQRIS